MRSEITWVLDRDDFENILSRRRTFIEEKYGWTIPDLIFDDFIDCFEDCEVHGSDSEIVDNLSVNGDYSDIYDFIDDNDENLPKLLNKAYDKETEEFSIYNIMDELESKYSVWRFPHDDEYDYDVTLHYFNKSIEEIVTEYEDVSYYYEINENKLKLYIKSNDKNKLSKVNEEIENTFNYIKNSESYHLGIIGFNKIDNCGELTYSYEFDVFAFPFGYAVRSY